MLQLSLSLSLSPAALSRFSQRHRRLPQPIGGSASCGPFFNPKGTTPKRVSLVKIIPERPRGMTGFDRTPYRARPKDWLGVQEEEEEEKRGPTPMHFVPFTSYQNRAAVEPSSHALVYRLAGVEALGGRSLAGAHGGLCISLRRRTKAVNHQGVRLRFLVGDTRE